MLVLSKRTVGSLLVQATALFVWSHDLVVTAAVSAAAELSPYPSVHNSDPSRAATTTIERRNWYSLDDNMHRELVFGTFLLPRSNQMSIFMKRIQRSILTRF
jgi:hypothetical protein